MKPGSIVTPIDGAEFYNARTLIRNVNCPSPDQPYYVTNMYLIQFGTLSVMMIELDEFPRNAWQAELFRELIFPPDLDMEIEAMVNQPQIIEKA